LRITYLGQEGGLPGCLGCKAYVDHDGCHGFAIVLALWIRKIGSLLKNAATTFAHIKNLCPQAFQFFCVKQSVVVNGSPPAWRRWLIHQGQAKSPNR